MSSPRSSRLVIEGKAKLDPKATYKAIIVSLPTPPLCVLLEGDAAACALVREALKTASPEGKPSLFIREAAEGRYARIPPHRPRRSVRDHAGPTTTGHSSLRSTV